MATVKIAITIDAELLGQLDALVKKRIFARSAEEIMAQDKPSSNAFNPAYRQEDRPRSARRA